MTTILYKVVLSLLVGSLIGGLAYVVVGIFRPDGSDDSSGNRSAGSKTAKKVKKKKRSEDNDDDSSGGRTPDTGLAPTKEWIGGSRG